MTRKEGEKRGSKDTTQRASRVQDKSNRTKEGKREKKKKKERSELARGQMT